MNVCHASRWELEDLEEAIRIQEADLIPRPPSALILVCFQLKQAHKLSRCDSIQCKSSLAVMNPNKSLAA